MKIQTGKIAIPIEFDNGDSDVIYINPTDRAFFKGLLLLGERVESRMKEINLDKYKTIMNDGVDFDFENFTADSIEQLSSDRLKSLQNKLIALADIDAEYQNAVKTELNELFKDDVSSKVFKYCQPLDNVLVDVNGEKQSIPFVQHFISEVAKEIQAYTDGRQSILDKHIGEFKQ